MSLPSEEAFSRLFRSLDGPERLTFVAELWAARGWETGVERSDVVAARDGVEQRIRVVDPGRFGSPPLDDVDVLVTARDRAGVRSAADAAGVRYVPPVAVYDELRYALDRETASALFAATFGQPLDASAPHVGPTPSERLRGWGARARRTASERLGPSRLVLSLLLVVVLLGAVVAGPAQTPSGAGAPEAAGTAPTATEAGGALDGGTDTETVAERSGRFPPGVGKNGISDLSALLLAHERAVSSRPRTLHVHGEGPANAAFMDGRLAWNYTASVERPSSYQFDAAYAYPPGTFSSNATGVDRVRIDVFATGGSNYRRRTDATGTSYLRYPTAAAGDASKFTKEVSQFLRYFLDEEESTTSCTTSGDAGAGIRTDSCRVVVTEPPETLPDAASYRALAVVHGNGLVTSLGVSYTLPDADGDGHRETVRFGFTYESLDTTELSEPSWLSDAKNATNESGSA